MKAVSLYALTTALVVVVVAALLGLALPAAAMRAVAVMGAVAWVVQVALFAPLYAARGRRNVFFAAWVGGTLARFAVVGLAAWWVWREGGLPLAPALLALASFLFLFLLIEPLFFRMGLRTR